MTPAEAFARIAAHCDELETDPHPGRLVAQVRAVLAEVTPEPGCTLDRDALLDMLRDALGQHRLDGSVAVGALADRVLALVRPVAGVTLAGDERIEALEALKPVLGRLEGEAHWRAPAVRALVERLEATR